jgi:NADP-dependent 3-hydroxy acid dehydrogenase YdfG
MNSPRDQNMKERIKDKVVVITGASSGLGEAAARRLAQNGAKLVLGARRLDRLQALAKELSLGSDAVMRTDVAQRGEVKRLVDRALQSHGRIDVIINNAGLMPLSPLERLKIDDWDRHCPACGEGRCPPGAGFPDRSQCRLTFIEPR